MTLLGPISPRPPVPGLQEALLARPMLRQRSKLWELNPSVHCSIIGTCLTTAELRQVMGKVLQQDVSRHTDHDLHSQAVGLCSQHNICSKQLQKALDRRHHAVITRFAKLSGEAAVMAAWAEARREGEIPGAYWAVLSHPDTGHAGLRRAFGDVHMLSHLVGAANRADIRRLAALEEENAALAAKVERQQQRLQEAIATRDATIRRLGTLAATQVTGAADTAPEDGTTALRELVAELQNRLSAEIGRRERVERRAAEATDAARGWERQARAAEAARDAMQQELALLDADETEARPTPLPAETVLYVGGRPGGPERMRDALAAAGGALLCHDGGQHDHISLLPGLIGRADRVVFPVDCVSHDAALTVKRLCRQLGKPWSPLRSTGFASFLAALAAAAPGTPHTDTTVRETAP